MKKNIKEAGGKKVGFAFIDPSRREGNEG